MKYVTMLVTVLFAGSVLAQATGFTAGPAVDIRSFGAVPNDGVADTPALIAAMSGGGRTVVIPGGEYLIGSVEIPGNTVLQLSPTTVLRDTGVLLDGQRLINIRSANVRIFGGGHVVANRASYTTGEQRHGVLIFGAHNVSIEGLESSSHGGDGFYIGGPAGNSSSEISLTGVLSGNNRRQGLSIVNGINVFVVDGNFNSTAGTRPALGIDLEPNNANDRLIGIVIRRPLTRNNAGGGISVGLSGFGASAPGASIDIQLHQSIGESPAFVASSLRPADRVNYTPCCTRAPR
jgi:hypothetical protein